jgi:hypothetical protein
VRKRFSIGSRSLAGLGINAHRTTHSSAGHQSTAALLEGPQYNMALLSLRKTLEEVIFAGAEIHYAPRFCRGAEYKRSILDADVDASQKRMFLANLGLPRFIGVLTGVGWGASSLRGRTALSPLTPSQSVSTLGPKCSL